MNRTKLPVVISLILLTSLACGLTSQIASEAPPAPEEPGVEEAEPAPLDEVEEPVSEEGQPEQESQLEVPDESDESAPEPPAIDALVPPPSADGGPCANTFYPMVPGYQWIYEVTSEGETSQISLTVSKVDGNEATLNALYLDSGVTTEATVECQDGAILNFPVMLLGFLFGDVDGELDVEHVDGEYAPSYSTLDSHNWDHSWTGEYLASGVIDAVVDGDQITGKLSESPVDMEWNTLGEGEAIFEAITIKAGEFPRAIKLEREIIFDFDAEMEESGYTVSVAAVLTLQNNLWFEPNIGQLKQEIERASIKVYGVNFPIEMTGSIELIEFRMEE